MKITNKQIEFRNDQNNLLGAISIINSIGEENEPLIKYPQLILYCNIHHCSQEDASKIKGVNKILSLYLCNIDAIKNKHIIVLFQIQEENNGIIYSYLLHEIALLAEEYKIICNTQQLPSLELLNISNKTRRFIEKSRNNIITDQK